MGLKKQVSKLLYLIIDLFYSSRLIGGSNYSTRDGHDKIVYNFYKKCLEDRETLPSISAVYRVRNGAETLSASVHSISALCKEIIIVDNGSTDDTLKIAHRLKRRLNGIVDIKIYSYDNVLAKAGEMYQVELHDNPAGSLADFYNFCFAKATSDYVMKADAHLLYVTMNLAKIQALLQKRVPVIRFRGEELFGRSLHFEPYVYQRKLKATYKDGEFFEVLDFPMKVGLVDVLRGVVFKPIFIHYKRIFFIGEGV
ncbi:MAG: glycosyltransferase [Colwellia sp.]|jgi:Glycosyl transferase family 2.